MTKKLLETIIIIVLIFGAMYLCSNLLVLVGKLKERSEKECVSAVAIANWEQTLEIAQGICIDVQNTQLGEIKKIYESQTLKLEADVKYWKDSYFWLKEQSAEIQEEIINN